MNSDRSRMKFAEEFSTITPGMTSGNIENLVGPCDRKRQLRHSRSKTRFPDILYPSVFQIWEYGVAGPSSFPTLGQILLSRKNKVVDVIGQGVPDSRLEAVDEERIRCVLGLFYQLRMDDFTSYNPLIVVKLANDLCSLDPVVAVVLIREYLRVGGDVVRFSQDLFSILLRVLFDPREDIAIFSSPPIGLITPCPPKNRSILPRYPVLLCSGIPFSGLVGQDMGGVTYSIEFEIDHFLENGMYRQSPLTPSDPVTQWQSVNRYLDNELAEWLIHENNELKRKLRIEIFKQMLRAVKSVYKSEELSREVFTSERAFETQVQRHLDALGNLSVGWDKKANDFVKNRN